MRSDRSLFLCSLGLSLGVLLTAVGLVAVDEQGRRLTLGDPAPAFEKTAGSESSTSLKINLFGQKTEVDITKIDEFLDFLLDFGCIPHK